MKFNKTVNADKQQVLKKVVWEDSTMAGVLRRRGLDQGPSDLGDALDAIFRELGMPRTLKEVGVGRDKFPMLATNSLKDTLCTLNPISLTRDEQVLEILEMCAE
jgi:alcohol dehydrogenase class IV